MDRSNDAGLTNELDNLSGTLNRTANVMTTADKMIDHYRDLTREKEREIEKLKNDLHLSFEERKYEADIYNRYRNSTRKSFRESPNDNRRISSTPRILRGSLSPKKRFKEKSSSSSNFEVTDASINYYSTPVNEDNREQINYHLKRIHQQIESDRERRKNQNKEMEGLTNDMRTLKEAMKENIVADSLANLSKSQTEIDQKLGTYKRKVEKQQVKIQLLTEQLEKTEKERDQKEIIVQHRSNTDDVSLQSNRLKVLEERLSKEERERMKVLKDYTDVQQRLAEADRERSELLFALSDVKAEAKSILMAYEETSQSLPELKSLLELSAKQKSEFSYQVTKLQGEIEGYRDENRKLKEKINEYGSVINITENENKKLNNKVDEIQSKYFELTSELKDTNQKLLETKHSLSNVGNEKQKLQDRALNTLKSYRSKCRKYEREVEEWAEKYKLKEKELLQSISESNELEFENIKQTKQFQELSHRMEELQGNITLYVDRCQQVSEEKNQLEITLSQSNDIKEEYYSIMNEQKKLKDEIHHERERRLEFESLCREYYENNLSLKNENSTLQLAIEKQKNELAVQRNNHMQTVNKTQEQCKVSTKDIELLTESNENLIQQLKTSTDYSKDVEEKYENVTRALEEQKIHTNEEILKSKELIKRMKALANDNKKIRKEFEMERQAFDSKAKTFESSVILKQEENADLQEHVENALLDTKTMKDYLKTIIDVISQDASNVLNLLCHEEEHVIPVKDLPKDIPIDIQTEISELREKLQSCFSITRILKERYNQQRVLIKRARERIKTQVDDIQNLIESKNKEKESHREEISELEAIQTNNKDLISRLEDENSSLHKRVNDLTKDLEKCTKALHKSLELAKERKTVLNEIDILNMENKERQMIDENLFRATGQVEVITEQLSEAKLSFHELKQSGMDTSGYAERMLESFQSISPTKKRRLLNFGSPLYI